MSQTKVTDSVRTTTALDATKLSGNLPAISGASLTNLPAGNLTGTVADARISTLTSSKLSGALPAIDGSNLTGVGGGGVKQVKTATLGTAYNNNSGSWHPIVGLKVSITPSSSSNKILIVAHLNLQTAVQSNSLCSFSLGRDGSVIGVGNSSTSSGVNCYGQVNQEGSSDVGRGGPYALTYLDAPSSTSAKEYSIMIISAYNNNVNYVNSNHTGTGWWSWTGQSSITVMEIDSSVL